MKYADVSGMSEKELLKKSKEVRGQMFEANMKNALGQLANPMTIRHLRRDVARLKTAMTAKAATQAPKAAAPKAPAKVATTVARKKAAPKADAPKTAAKAKAAPKATRKANAKGE